ncbi:MAG: DUF3131 domain-containing protein [Thiolinea sp.]
MSFKQGLIRARSHLIFLFGLITAFSLVFWLESIEPQLQDEAGIRLNKVQLEQTYTRTTPVSRQLTAEERAWANIAWTYFKNNTIPETGLVNSVDNYESSTLWDTASYLMAVISAHRLQLISDIEFDSRIILALKALKEIPLFNNQLPNKVYHTRNLTMVDYKNQPTEKGIGWSAIDIGRIMVPFNVLVWHYPHHSDAVGKVLKRWDIESMLREGSMYGAAIDNQGEIIYLQEGRLGYEEYAAKSFNLIGRDVSRALDYFSHLNMVDIYGVEIATDSRTPEQFQAHNYVVSEPYILDGIEFGWDLVSRELAARVYQAQEKRYQETDILTAVSEDNIDQAPYFVYNTVFTDSKAWNAISESGEDASAFKTLSTKAVFGWNMLYETAYTRQLMDRIKTAFDPERGWYSGIYEADNKPNTAITANTNGIILEALAFRQTGQLMKIGK